MKRIVILTALGCLLPTLIHAQMCEWVCDDPDATPVVAGSYNNKIILSEFLPNPEGDDGESEFIELQNLTNKSVQLQGWWIEDESGRKYQFNTEEVKANGFLAVERSVSRISLNNTGGDEVTLYSPDEEMQDQVAYEGTAKEGWAYALGEDDFVWTMTPTPSKKNVIEIPNDPPELDVEIPKEIFANNDVMFSAESSEDPDGDPITGLWQFSDDVRIEGMTATRQFDTSGEYEVKVTIEDDHNHKTFDHFTFTVSPFDLAQNVTLNELYPKPAEGEDEFIEIKNTEGRTVELGGWQLTDGSRTYTCLDDTTIEDGAYFVVYKDTTGIALNDTGDQVTLIRPDESEADTMSYTSANRGESYSRYADTWEWAYPTPWAENEVRDEGLVLGATAHAQELPSSASQSGDVTFEQPFIDRYGLYGVVGVALGVLGFGFYKKWKRDKQAAEEFDLT